MNRSSESKAIQEPSGRNEEQIPAFAGMTGENEMMDRK